MLWIKAKGGLGNRILSAATAIAYAKSTNRNFVIDWCDGVYANDKENAYPKLFQSMNESDSIFDENSFDESSFIKKGYQVSPVIWKDKLHLSVSEMISNHFQSQHSNPLVYRKLSAPLTHTPYEKTLEVFWSYTSKLGRIKPFTKQKPRTLIKDALNEYFTPHKEIQHTLQEKFDNNNAKTLGVHIRYTDLKVPIHKIIKKLASCIKKHHYERIFLSTDNENIEEEIKQLFPNTFTFEKAFGLNNSPLHNNINENNKLLKSKAAILDMYGLAHCDGLLYSSRSSFSRISHLVGGFTAKNSYNIDKFNPRIRLKCFLQEYL